MTDSDKPKFAELMAALGAGMAMTVDKAQLTAYWLFLGDLAIEDFERAVGVAGRTLKWFPKPAELRELAEGPRRITAAMQWAHVRRTIDTIDIYGSPDFGALVNAVIHSLGGWKELCELDIEELKWARKDFGRLYDEFSAKDLTALRTVGHVGEFGKAPTWCALEGTPKPPKMLGTKESNGVSDHVRKLADSKSVNQLAEGKS